MQIYENFTDMRYAQDIFCYDKTLIQKMFNFRFHILKLSIEVWLIFRMQNNCESKPIQEILLILLELKYLLF